MFLFQIVALNKTKERMRPYQSNQEDEDPDIKKIKKVDCNILCLESPVHVLYTACRNNFWKTRKQFDASY